jgi:hypothetical protein
MARNISESLSPAAWFAPLFAPVFAVPMFLQIETRHSAQFIDLVLWTVVVAYVLFALVALPVFLLTRTRVTWTPGRVLLLGAGTAISPMIIAFGWGFVKALLSGTQQEYFFAVLKQDWSVFMSFLLCGLVVALAFVVLQRKHHASAI